MGILPSNLLAQTNVWWDTNGSGTAGAGSTPTGTWDLAGNNKVWNSNSGGTGSSSTLKGWSNGDNAFFSAGADATNPFTVTVSNASGNVTVNNITFEEGTPTIAGSTLTLTGTASSTSTITTTSSGTISASLAGVGINLTKAGSATLTLSGNDTYSGTTTISAGTLKIDNNNSTTLGRLAGTTKITVASGGTLLLAQSSGGTANNNRINDSATMTLNANGSSNIAFDTGGLSEHGASNNTAGIGALTLQSTSIIDLGAGNSIIAFANSNSSLGNSTAWNGTLKIYDWTGTVNQGGGIDQLYFGNNNTGLSASQLAEVSFYSDAGTTFLGTAKILSTGEIVPIPEPSTWFAAGLTVLALGYFQRRKLVPALKLTSLRRRVNGYRLSVVG